MHAQQAAVNNSWGGLARAQEFGLTPIMWQLADLARWLDPRVNVITVVHSPRATPNLEERGLLRTMAQHSHRLVVMTWYGWHSLVAAYGIDPAKLVYIPHGVHFPARALARRQRAAGGTAGRTSAVTAATSRQLLADAGAALCLAGALALLLFLRCCTLEVSLPAVP